MSPVLTGMSTSFGRGIGVIMWPSSEVDAPRGGLVSLPIPLYHSHQTLPSPESGIPVAL
jgi:hypothetical protein